VSLRGLGLLSFKVLLQPLVFLIEEILASLQVRDDVLKLTLLAQEVIILHLPSRFLFFDIEKHLGALLIRLLGLLLGI
jgi:hypothetical protein